MIRKFINREEELEFLENEFAQNNRSFVVIYGRRRVGKTELIKKFIADKPSIYFLVSQEPSNIQLERLIEKIALFFSERVPIINNWIEAIEYIGDKLRQKRVVLAIDEFPYLIESNGSIPSYFQKLNDEYLNDSKSMLIISGSSIGMMESKVLGHKSPMYGRRTGQIDLVPFSFKKVGQMIQNRIEERIVVYAVFGDIPMYLSFYDTSKSLKDNILQNMLNKNSFLYKEPEFILKQELREPARYLSILTSIAEGNTRLNEISNKTGIVPGTLSKYISQLMKLRLIKRDVPVTERNKKSKKSLYQISDPLFDFWFRFIEPNISDVENNPKNFLEYSIVPNLAGFVSKTFEKVCREFLNDYGTVGRWWHKDKEIDIVATNNKEMLFCECKWKSNVDAKKIFEKLREKSNNVPYKEKRYAIFAKSFKERIKIENLSLYDLNDLGKAFN